MMTMMIHHSNIWTVGH